MRVIAENEGDRVAIGDRVEFVEERNGIPFFRKAPRDPAASSPA